MCALSAGHAEPWLLIAPSVALSLAQTNRSHPTIQLPAHPPGSHVPAPSPQPPRPWSARSQHPPAAGRVALPPSPLAAPPRPLSAPSGLHALQQQLAACQAAMSKVLGDHGGQSAQAVAHAPPRFVSGPAGRRVQPPLKRPPMPRCGILEEGSSTVGGSSGGCAHAPPATLRTPAPCVRTGLRLQTRRLRTTPRRTTRACCWPLAVASGSRERELARARLRATCPSARNACAGPVGPRAGKARPCSASNERQRAFAPACVRAVSRVCAWLQDRPARPAARIASSSRRALAPVAVRRRVWR